MSLRIPLSVARRAILKTGRTTPFIQQNRTMAGYWNRDWRPADEVPKVKKKKKRRVLFGHVHN